MVRSERCLALKLLVRRVGNRVRSPWQVALSHLADSLVLEFCRHLMHAPSSPTRLPLSNRQNPQGEGAGVLQRGVRRGSKRPSRPLAPGKTSSQATPKLSLEQQKNRHDKVASNLHPGFLGTQYHDGRSRPNRPASRIMSLRSRSRGRYPLWCSSCNSALRHGTMVSRICPSVNPSEG